MESKDKICQCGHPYELHLEPEYKETICTDPDCKCKNFVLKEQVSEDAVKEELSDKIYEAMEEWNGKSFKEKGYKLTQEFIAEYLLSAGYSKLVLPEMTDEMIKDVWNKTDLLGEFPFIKSIQEVLQAYYDLILKANGQSERK